jgi:mannose-6-phosphate isomerase-like protein (cupin superfamily)
MEILFHRRGQGQSVVQLGPYELEPLIPRDQEGAMTCYRVRIAPFSRTATSWHAKAEEIYYVLAGRGVAVLNHQAYPVQAGDFLRLPPGTLHAFITEAEPLELLDIHSPGSWPDRDLYFADEGSTSA